jgi:hypothetical protein
MTGQTVRPAQEVHLAIDVRVDITSIGHQRCITHAEKNLVGVTVPSVVRGVHAIHVATTPSIPSIGTRKASMHAAMSPMTGQTARPAQEVHLAIDVRVDVTSIGHQRCITHAAPNLAGDLVPSVVRVQHAMNVAVKLMNLALSEFASAVLLVRFHHGAIMIHGIRRVVGSR